MFSKTAKRRTAPALDSAAAESAGLAPQAQLVVRPKARLAFAGALLVGLASLTAFVLLAAGPATPPAAADHDPCPNADLRTGLSAHLPGCRAYEVVSPVDKGGQHVETGGASVSSASGEQVVYEALGVFAGSPSNLLPNFYLGSRNPASWATISLNLPVDPKVAFNQSGVVAVSTDLSHTVVRSNAPISPGAWDDGLFLEVPLYVRNASDGSYQLLSPQRIDGSDPYQPTFAEGDADFSHVLFETEAELTAEAVGVSGNKLYEWVDGVVSLASVLPDGSYVEGTAGTGSFIEPGVSALDQDLKGNGMISQNGSKVFFTSPVGIVAGLSVGQLYLRRQGETVLVNREENTADSILPGAATFRGATPDGSKVFFTSEQELIDGAGPGLYLYTDSANPDTDANLSFIAPSVRGVLDFSTDGSKVYFSSDADLVDGAPITAGPKIWLWEDGVVKFVAGFSAGTSQDRVWRTSPEAQTARYVTPDGGSLLLATSEQLTDYDNQQTNQMYLYRAATSTSTEPDLTCISCEPSAAPPVGPAGALRGKFQRHLSDDGTRAFFESPESLVPEDTNNRVDVYLWEGGEPHLITTGQQATRTQFVAASASGSDVFFVTAEPLVGVDQDELGDLYDARVGGGFPEPDPDSPPCQGDACQNPPSGPPDDPEAGSGSWVGPGNPPAQAKPKRTGCKKLKSKKKRRISKKKRRKCKRAQRAGAASGGHE